MGKAVVRYTYDTPRPVTVTVDLPEDWNEYNDFEKREFYEDNAPQPYSYFSGYEAVEEEDLPNG